jgi:hypothetical protein
MPPMEKKDETKDNKDANKDAIAKGKVMGNTNEEQDSGACFAGTPTTSSPFKTDGELFLFITFLYNRNFFNQLIVYYYSLY